MNNLSTNPFSDKINPSQSLVDLLFDKEAINSAVSTIKVVILEIK